MKPSTKKIYISLILATILLVISSAYIFKAAQKELEKVFVEIFKTTQNLKHYESRHDLTVYGILHKDEYVSSSGGFRLHLSIKVDKIEKSEPEKNSGESYKKFNWYLTDLYPYERIGLKRAEIEEHTKTKYPGTDMIADYFSRKIKIRGIIIKYNAKSGNYFLKSDKKRGKYSNYNEIFLEGGSELFNKIQFE